MHAQYCQYITSHDVHTYTAFTASQEWPHRPTQTAHHGDKGAHRPLELAQLSRLPADGFQCF